MFKVAILLFGQPRIILSYDYFHKSLMEYLVKNNEYYFDFYIHHWVSEGGLYPTSKWAGDAIQPPAGAHEYQLQTYKPLKYRFEKQRFFSAGDSLHAETERPWWTDTDISQMLSQVYSLSSACNLIEDPDTYTWFIAVRTDCELLEHLPLLRDLPNDKMNCYSDVIQIFGHNSFDVYSHLMSNLREVPIRGQLLNAESMRRCPLERAGIETNDLGSVVNILRRDDNTELYIENLRDGARVTGRGIYYHRVGNSTTIRFPPGVEKIIHSSQDLVTKNGEVLVSVNGIVESPHPVLIIHSLDSK